MHNSISSSGGSTLADLLQALEDYLPVLLGLVKDGNSCFRLLVLYPSSFHSMYLMNCLPFLCRKSFTIQSTICLDESGGWSRGSLVPDLFGESGECRIGNQFFSSLSNYFSSSGVIDTCRKQPCLMLGMKCCQSCTWLQHYCYHRLIYYFFQEHPPMVISQKYQKVSHTEIFYYLLFITPNDQNTVYQRIV